VQYKFTYLLIRLYLLQSPALQVGIFELLSMAVLDVNAHLSYITRLQLQYIELLLL